MNCYRIIGIYCKIRNDVIILVINIHPAVIGVELDATEFRMYKSFLYLITCVFRSVPYIHIRKATESAIFFTNIKQVLMCRINSEIHRHQPRIIEWHDDCPPNIELIHDLLIGGNFSKGKLIIRVRVCGMNLIRNDVYMCINLWNISPLHIHAPLQILPIWRLPGKLRFVCIIIS